jgi:error-prone DNA polymerase
VSVFLGSARLPVSVLPEGDASGRWQGVARVVDVWKVNDRWWRGPEHEVSRQYFELLLQSGRRAVIFRDLLQDQWYLQNEWNHEIDPASEFPRGRPLNPKTAQYAELHCHTAYSFKDGASAIDDLLLEAKRLGLSALAITDHNNLCGAMRWAQAGKALGIKVIIGVEVTLASGHHLTLLAETAAGYSNICELVTRSYFDGKRLDPRLNPELLAKHAEGVICLSGCRQSELSQLALTGDMEAARAVAEKYARWFGKKNYFVELEQNLVKGDTARNRRLAHIAREAGVGIVATNNVHYHTPERHRLNDCLASREQEPDGTVKVLTLEQSRAQRRPNNEACLKSPAQMAHLFDSPVFGHYPEAVRNTVRIANRCSFDLTDAGIYRFPDYPGIPEGQTEISYLRSVCEQAARRKYGGLLPHVVKRLDRELALIEKHRLAGFFLTYYDIAKVAREVQEDLGLVPRGLPLEERPPGRGRGSSVAMVVCYLLGLSHIDPLQFDLRIERFLPDTLTGPPDIDLDFPRAIREELILRVHEQWGDYRAVLTGAHATYKLAGAVELAGKVLGIPKREWERLSDGLDNDSSASSFVERLRENPDFRERLASQLWQDFVSLVSDLIGLPKNLMQHSGGMVLGAGPLSRTVPVLPGGIEDRLILQWDKNDGDDAGFVKIDFLALGALSQMDESVGLILQRHEGPLDITRIDFTDQHVYDSICSGDTVGTFQIESAAQRQTVIRLRPRNLVQLAWEVAAVRPGVGVNDGVSVFIRRHNGEPWDFDHPRERKALERTYGVPIYQDQLEELAREVASFNSGEASAMRKAYTRPDASKQVPHWRKKFIEGAMANGVPEETAVKIVNKFTGHYQFPESHAYAFAVTAFQLQWLKVYYPLEFFVGLFNNQPMGFYNLESLKEDAKRHGVKLLNPDANRSGVKAVIDNGQIRAGFAHVLGVGEERAQEWIVDQRDIFGPYKSLADFVYRTGLSRAQLEALCRAGAFDCFASYPESPNRLDLLWEIGVLHRPLNKQGALRLPVEQDLIRFNEQAELDLMLGEYEALGFHPGKHIMELLRPELLLKESSDGLPLLSSAQLQKVPEDQRVRVAGLRFRLQHPNDNVYFMGLEDEFGHMELLLWPAVFKHVKSALIGSKILTVTGVVSRREGTLTVEVDNVTAVAVPAPELVTKDFS